MEMFRRIFFVTMLVGVAAGLVSSAIQQWRVVPYILAAEVFETQDHHQDSVDAHTHESNGATAPETQQAWAPKDGAERIGFTIFATVLTSLGFAFLMMAVSTLFGPAITPANGLLWGLGGFLTFSLMPAIGLSPELPGMVGADLTARQIWWWGTALSTAAALLIMVKFPKFLPVLLALILLAIPHLIGAPASHAQASQVPAHLASSFAANALFASLAFWLMLGFGFGYVNEKQMKD